MYLLKRQAQLYSLLPQKSHHPLAISVMPPDFEAAWHLFSGTTPADNQQLD